MHRQKRLDRCGGKIADVAFDFDVTKFVAVTFFDDISDDEIALVGRQFGHCRHNAEIGIAIGQIKLPQLALVIGKTIRIIAVVRRKEAIKTRPLGNHLATQPTIAEHFITDDVDLADLRLRSLADFVDNIDTVLVEHHHLGLDRRSEPTLAAIQLDDAGNIGTNL